MSNPLTKITLLGAIALITLIFVSSRSQPVQAAGFVPVSIGAFPNVPPLKLYGGSNTILRTLAPAITVVNSGPDVDASTNDFRRIQNALNSAASGDTIILNGTFDFSQPFAAAAWALGNDNLAGTGDDYEVLVPAGLNNVTLTANNLGDATIQGPGDLAAINLESFLVFDSSLSGASQGWTISKLQILDFDLAIGMFASAPTDYNNTIIQNNLIRIATDLNATVAPADSLQNIAIHLSFGTNQTVSGNTIHIQGNGVSDSANSNFSSEVGLQSSTSGGSVYDGLTISNNSIHVLNAQSADPQNILGIWENSHGHTGNVTISGNSFINDAAGNSPSLNLQKAFRVTSHSGASSLVKYDSNTVNGANIGFQWLAGSNFSSNQAVVLIGNQITNSNTGVLIQSGGIAHFENNVITGSGSGGGIHLTIGTLTGSPATFPANFNSIYRTTVSGGAGHGVWIEGTAGSVAPLSQNDLSGNANFALLYEPALSIKAENNWWGNNLAANVASKVSGNVDFNPWLASGTDVNAATGFQPFIFATTSGAITTFVGTAAADTASLLAGDPITMTMNGETATTPLAQLLNFDIQPGDSDDIFTLGQTGIPTVFNGGSGNDTLVGTNVAQTWNTTGTNSGNILSATSSFTSVENLTGGTNADYFVIGVGTFFAGLINGNLGSDTLDNSAIPGHVITFGGPGSLDGRNGSASGLVGGFDNINNFFPSPSSVTGTKTVTGTFAPNGSIAYTVVLTNSSAFAQLDNPGNEFADVLPAGLTLVSAIATDGTAAANTGTNTVTWNGSIANGASVTVTINATVNSNAGGTAISNQGTINYDADGNGTNEVSSLTDNPLTVAANDPTDFSVCANIVIVTTNVDSGAGSLRQAITSACNGATINFDINQVVSPIILTTGQLLIDKDLTIQGPGADELTVQRSSAGGTPNFRIFDIQPTTAGAIVSISALTISGGNLSGTGGGGAYLGAPTGGQITLDSVAVTDNLADDGGGINVNGPGTVNILNCLIAGNTADNGRGGGIQNSGTLTLVNSTISGNTSTNDGGGIQNFGSSLKLTHVTITNNRADSDNNGGVGGGIKSVSSPNAIRINNSIVAGNFRGPLSTADDLVDASTIDTANSFNNLVGVGGSLGNGVNGNQVGVANAGLAPLGNNVGRTLTHALLVGSPALDKGDNTRALDQNNAALIKDQRGFTRIVDGPDADTTATADIGAFEAQVSLEDISDKSTNEDTQIQFTFNVGGAPTTVGANSGNPTLVPNNPTGIVVSGSGSARTLTINPALNKFGTAIITVQANIPSGGIMTDTFVLTVNPIADTPSVNNATADEDNLTFSGMVINRNAADGAEVTHFKITNIQNGTLLQSNFTTQINNGDFITVAEGNAGLRFAPGANLYSPGTTFSFQAQASVNNTDAGLGGGLVTATITVSPVPDTPSVTNATTTLNTQTTSGLVISRHPGDGAEVTHFRITNTQHGTLFKSDGTTQIIDGNFITVAEGNAGLKFTPARNLTSPATTFSFEVSSSLSNSIAGLAAGPATATITVNCGPTVVTNNNDNGPGSLRAVANSACAGSVITFDMIQVISPITLTSDEMFLDRSLTFQGPGANLLTIQRSAAAGTPLFRFFHIFEPAVTTTISGLTLSNADTTDGGGAIRNFGTLIVNGVTFSNNHTSNAASAIFSNGTLTVSNSTFSGNRADEFAAIFNTGGLATISNTTFTGNANLGDAPGSVIFNNSDTGTNLINCTISQNIGQAQVLFHNPGPGQLTLKNSILSGNTGANGLGFTDNGNNIIGGNPLLAPLGNYGGPTQTMALLPGSPAIDAGTSTGAPATDQRGIARVGAVDIGAFESRGFTIAATSGSGQITPILTAFALPLTATVSSAFTEPVTGGLVTFNAPPGRASCTFPGNVTTTSVSINAAGAAILAPTANGFAGPYDVIAGLGSGQQSVNFALTNAKANQTITFGSLPNKIAADPDFSVSATASSGLTVSFAASGQCTIAGTTVHLTGAGSCTITASQAGNSNVNAAPDVPRSFTIAGADQTITFGSLPNKLATDPDFSVSATASSGLAISFAASGQCTIAGTTVHLTGVGSCTITASQAGDSNFNAAPDVQRSFTISGPLVSLSQTNYNVNESTGFVAITVNRAGDLSVPVTVDYATDDTGSPNICSTLNGGLAAARCDFGLILGTLRFAATETQKTFVIPITQDSFAEGPETFTVSLSNLNGNSASLVTPTSATITINDSAAPAPNASDDTDAFVRQQYRDFLNREADAAGLAFWKNNIDKCNDPAQRPPGQTLIACIEVQRIITSAAFFLSIEFQQTGVFVRDFYVAALDRPATNSQPLLVEFLRDVEAVQSGVVVGVGNWQQILDSNRAAFMNDFVTRAEFAGLYPTTDTPTQYVDKLYQHAAVTGPAQERLDAIAEFNGAATASDPEARARALLRITQNAAFRQREGNRAFVFMEYIGYLRRSPNDPPDGNFDGYNFWLTKLNQFNGDFLQAEMVKAFLSSIEYRQRFGQ